MAKKKFQFSKWIILFETVLVGYLTYHGVQLAYLCVENGFSGSLAFITTLLSCAWGAYGTSVAFYYNKAKAENQLKIPNTQPVTVQELRDMEIDAD